MSKYIHRSGQEVNRLNLMLLDPFFPEIEAVLFRSHTTFDNDLFKENDMIIKSVI